MQIKLSTLFCLRIENTRTAQALINPSAAALLNSLMTRDEYPDILIKKSLNNFALLCSLP